MTERTVTSPADHVDDCAQFGDYLLAGLIARGGMAEVFRARRLDGRDVLAIKVMRPKLAKEARFVEMFEREAKLNLLLRHPNIVRAHEAGEVHRQPYIAMEYIGGADVSHVVRRAAEQAFRISVPMAVYIAQAMAAGLGYAHQVADPAGRPLQIVNRDVSPSNVRIAFTGEVKILDFGIAQALTKYTNEIGVLKGKLSYMSPEQVRGLPVDARTDVFSTGIVLHELLTGEKLFRGDTEFALMERVQTADIVPPSSKNKRVPPELDAIVLRALARDPTERTPSAEALSAELLPWLAHYQFDQREMASAMTQLFRAEVAADALMRQEVANAEPPEMVELILEEIEETERVEEHTPVQRKRTSGP